MASEWFLRCVGTLRSLLAVWKRHRGRVKHSDDHNRQGATESDCRLPIAHTRGRLNLLGEAVDRVRWLSRDPETPRPSSGPERPSSRRDLHYCWRRWATVVRWRRVDVSDRSCPEKYLIRPRPSPTPHGSFATDDRTVACHNPRTSLTPGSVHLQRPRRAVRPAHPVFRFHKRPRRAQRRSEAVPVSPG